MNRTLTLCSLLGMTLASCGTETTKSSATLDSDQSSVTTQHAPTDGGTSASTIVASSPAITEPAIPTTSVPAAPLTVLGPVRFTLPLDAHEFPPATDFTVPGLVTAKHTWAISDTGIVGVTVQAVIPLFPADELIADIDANGLHWQVYDTGPENGSITNAYAVIGENSAVLVAGQAWRARGSNTATADATALIRGRVTDVVRSLTYHG